MKQPVKTQDLFINTLIGQGTNFRGDIQVEGLLRIDGDFWGQIRSSSRVYIGAGGRVKSQIAAREVVVGGALKGDIVASDKVIILSTGLVIGNIYAPRLTLEEGCVVEGYCSITPRIREQMGTSPQTYLQTSHQRQYYSEGTYNPFDRESTPSVQWKE